MDGSAFVLESGGQAPLVTQPFFREEGKIGDGAVHEPPDQPLAELEAGLERALVKLRPPQVRGSPDHEAHSPTATGGGGPQIFQPTQAAAIVVMEHVQQVPELAATERAAPQLEEGQEVPESTHAAAAACQLEEGQPAPDVALALDAGPQREEGQQLPSSPQETAGPAEQVGQQEPETARVAEGAPEWQQGLEVSRQAASAAADPGHGLQGPDSTQPAAAPVASASAVTAETPAAAAAASPPSGAALGSPTGRQGGDVATAYQSEQTHSGGQNGGKPKLPRPEGVQECPRCSSKDTKFCYYNNYNIKQPRYFCRACQRYWTAGGSLREIPVGAGRRKSKAAKKDGFTGERGPQAATAATAVPPSAGEPALSAAAVAMAASMAAAPAVSMVLQPSAAPLGLSAPVRNPLPVAAPGLLGPAPVLPQDPALAALLAAGGGGGAGLPLPNGTSLGAGVPPQMTMPGALPPPYGMQPPGAVPSMMPQGNPYMPLRAGGLVQGLGAVPPHAAAPGLPPFIGAPPRITAVPSSFPPASYPPAAPAQTLSSLSSLPTGPPVTAGAAGPSAAAVLSETLNKLTALPSSALGGPHGYPPPLTALTSLGQGSLPTSSAMAAAAQALGAAQSLGGRVDGSGAAMGSSYGVDDSLPGGSRPAMVPMAQPLQQDEDCEEDGGMDRDGDRAAKRTKLEPAVLETAAAAAAAAAAQGRMDEPGGPGTAINAWQQQEPGVPQQREPAFPPGPSPNPLTDSAISALATLAAAAQGAAAMGPSLASSGAPGMVPQPLPPAPTASPFGGGPSAYGPSTHASSLATLGRFYEGLAGAAGPHAMPAALGHGLGGSMGSMLGPSDATLGVAGPLSSEFFAAARAAAQQQQQGLGLAQQLPPGPYGHPGGPMHALAGGGGGWPYGGGMGPFIPHQQQGWGGGYPPQGPGYGMPRYQFPSFGGLGAAPNPLTPQMPSAGLGLTGLGSMLGGAAAAALPPSLREAEMARALAQVPTCAPPSSVPLGWLGGAAGPSSWAGMPPSNGLVGLAQLNPNLNPAGYPTALNSHHHQQQQQQPFSMLPQHQQPPLQQQQQQQQYLPPALLGQGGGYGVDLAGLLPPGAGGFFPGAGQGAFGLGGGPPGAAMVPEAAPSQMDSARA